jgi:hypothetical protein
MKRFAGMALGALALALGGCATEYSVSPVANSAEQVRYWHGKPTIYSEMRFGAVQVVPLGVNGDDRVGFEVVALNKSGEPANFGTENISLTQQNGRPDKIFTTVELDHEAKVKAQWQEFAVALAGGLEMYAASRNSVSTTSGTAYTPLGPVNYYSSTYNPALAQANMQVAGAQMQAGLQTIAYRLDQKLSAIHGSVLQTTTIDPGQADGGVAIADELSSSQFPQQVVLHVNWLGEDHVFTFSVAKGVDQVVRQASAPVAPTATAAEIAASDRGDASNAAASQPAHASAMVSFADWKGSAKHTAVKSQHAVIEGAVGPED